MKYICLILLIIPFSSCDLLTTRPPEKPNTQGNGNVPATSPDILFNNLKSSLSSKVLENYLACLDSSFQKRKFKFIPSSGSASQYPALNGWNYDSESKYFKKLIFVSNPGQTVTLGLTNNSVTQLGGDSAIFQFDYTLNFIANDKNISGNYTGTAQFKINIDSRGQYIITDWYDYKKENLQSWSELKGRLAY